MIILKYHPREDGVQRGTGRDVTTVRWLCHSSRSVHSSLLTGHWLPFLIGSWFPPLSLSAGSLPSDSEALQPRKARDRP